MKGEVVRRLHHEVRPRLSHDCVEGVGAVLSSTVPCGIVRQASIERRPKDAGGTLYSVYGRFPPGDVARGQQTLHVDRLSGNHRSTRIFGHSTYLVQTP